jgi:hypothetical protein
MTQFMPVTGAAIDAGALTSNPNLEPTMRYLLPTALIALIFSFVPSLGFADDCVAQLNAQQKEIYSKLSPESQKIMSSEIKTRQGAPASCDFRSGMLDMLANFPPEKRDAAFMQLVNKMLIRQQ